MRREAPRPSRAPERRVSLRSRRRRTRFAAVAVVLVAIMALAYGIHWISYLPKFSIISIRVEGAHKSSPSEIISYANTIIDDGAFHYLSRRNIFFYPRRALEVATVQHFPRIQRVSIARATMFSDELIMTVNEREAFARWCSEETEESSTQCYWMDVDGFVFAQVADGESGATTYAFSRGLSREGAWPIGAVFAPGHVPGMVVLLNNLEKAGYRPRGASIENDQDFFVPLEQGFYIKASFGQDAVQLVNNLELVMRSEAIRGKEGNLEYIDLRFGNRVYYKFKGEVEVSSQ